MNIYSPRNKGVSGNIWKLAILYITNKRPYMTFLTIFLLLMPNTNAQTIGLLTAVGQITGVLFEVPSGYISDKIGHKNALVIAKIAYLLSTLCYIFATSKIYFFAGAIFFAIGIAMLSGTTSTFLKESLVHIGLKDRYSDISGKLRSFGFIIPVGLILLVSFVAEMDFRIAFVAVGIIDVIGLVTTLRLVSVPKEIAIKEFQINKSSNIFKEYFSLRWLPYVIAFELLLGIIFGSTIGFKNPFQESLGISVAMLGILWAMSRVVISGLLLANGWIQKRINFFQLYILQAVGFITSLLIIGLSGNKWIIAAGFILATATMWGTSSIKSHYYLEYIEDSPYKMSMLSLNTLFQKMIIGISGFVMGFMVVKYGFANSYFYFALALSFVAVISALVLYSKRQSK